MGATPQYLLAVLRTAAAISLLAPGTTNAQQESGSWSGTQVDTAECDTSPGQWANWSQAQRGAGVPPPSGQWEAPRIGSCGSVQNGSSCTPHCRPGYTLQGSVTCSNTTLLYTDASVDPSGVPGVPGQSGLVCFIMQRMQHNQPMCVHLTFSKSCGRP
jgi:hypothetical protein